MHFKNGREAKTGDHVITKDYNGNIVGGVIFDLHASSGDYNCNVEVIRPGGSYTLTCQNVGLMYHVEDAFYALEAKTPPEPGAKTD